MEKMWRVFEVRELPGTKVEERGGHMVILDQKSGVIVHTTGGADLEKIEKYSRLKKQWGSKYVEVYEPGTEFINATLVIAVDWRNRERTVIL